MPLLGPWCVSSVLECRPHRQAGCEGGTEPQLIRQLISSFPAFLPCSLYYFSH